MKLQRVSRACAAQTFGSAFADAAGPGMPRIVKAAVYLPASISCAAAEIRAAMLAQGYAGAADVVAVEPLGQPDDVLFVIWMAEPSAALGHPAPDVTVAQAGSYDVAWFGNLGWSTDYEQVFAGAQEKLRAAGMNVANLWKTWSYLPVDASSGRADDAFAEFNERRAAWFEGVGFQIEPAEPVLPFAFPANTGVGDLAGYFSLSGIAGRARDGLARVVEIDNPHQQSPRKYGTGHSGRRAPAHFSRAVAVLGPGDHWVLVAGTASVVGSATVNIDAVSSQTAQTLANLATLAAEAGKRCGSSAPAVSISEAYENLVVYVTHAEHLDAVRQTVETVAQAVPVMYLRSPLTRADLLVEMEGELT